MKNKIVKFTSTVGINNMAFLQKLIEETTVSIVADVRLEITDILIEDNKRKHDGPRGI